MGDSRYIFKVMGQVGIVGFQKFHGIYSPDGGISYATLEIAHFTDGFRWPYESNMDVLPLKGGSINFDLTGGDDKEGGVRFVLEDKLLFRFNGYL
jgi:hypothetical protein